MTWWKRLEDVEKALTAAIFIVAMALAAFVALNSFAGLPGRVEVVEDKLGQIEYRQGDILDAIERTNCYLDNLMEDNLTRRCP